MESSNDNSNNVDNPHELKQEVPAQLTSIKCFFSNFSSETSNKTFTSAKYSR